MTIKETVAVLAYPEKAYVNVSRTDAIQSYEKMSIDDFEKLFESDDVLKFEKSEFSIQVNQKMKPIVRHVAPFTRFKKWNGKDANDSSMVSVIYTEPDGFPVAEYSAVHNLKRLPIEFGKDLEKFYRDHGWTAYGVAGIGGFPEYFNEINERFPKSVEMEVLKTVLGI